MLSGGSQSDAAYYQAETLALTRENQMLKLRIRELGGSTAWVICTQLTVWQSDSLMKEVRCLLIVPASLRIWPVPPSMRIVVVRRRRVTGQEGFQEAKRREIDHDNDMNRKMYDYGGKHEWLQ